MDGRCHVCFFCWPPCVNRFHLYAAAAPCRHSFVRFQFTFKMCSRGQLAAYVYQLRTVKTTVSSILLNSPLLFFSRLNRFFFDSFTVHSPRFYSRGWKLLHRKKRSKGKYVFFLFFLFVVFHLLFRMW